MFITFYRRLLTVLLISSAFAAFPTLTSAGHSWGNYHWARTSNPFTLKLGDNVSSAWDSSLIMTSADWSLSSVLDTSIVAGGAGTKNSKKCKPISGQVEVCNSTYGNNGWLGLAQIWISGSHITQGVAKLNDTYFNTAKYNTPEERNSVMCQEVGHTLGLDHQDEDPNNTSLGTCMDYSNNPIYDQHPNAHDYEQLGIIYAHFDSTTTVGQTVNDMPPAANDIDFSGPAQWGRLIRSSKSGRTERYELDFGGGHKVFTFVIWAEGEERGQR